MIIPLLIIMGASAALIAVAVTSGDNPPNHPQDLPMPFAPGSTGWKGVDAIMDRLPDGSPGLRTAANTSGVPLGVLVAWIGCESGGRLGETTRYDERGYFQLMPDESKTIGVDHQRLSTDPHYSIDAGIKLIARYVSEAQSLGVAPTGSSYFWKLVKFLHSLGSGGVRKIVNEAKLAGQAGSWAALENYAITNDSHFLSVTKHSPKKWMPFVDKVAAKGAPFGFGSDSTMVVGAVVFPDIPDVLDLLPKYKGRKW